MREQQPPTTLPFLGVGDGPGRRARGEGRWGGADQCGSNEGWVREWCRRGRGGGGPVVVLGHEGGRSGG